MEAEFSGADILCHIHRGAIGAEQQFLVKSVGGEVGPHRVVVLAVENALFKTFEHLFLTFEVSVAFVVNLVEAHTHACVGFVETGIHPFVHGAPERTNFLVAVFPLLEHGACLFHQGRVCLSLFFGHAAVHELLQLFFIVLVESHIEVTNQVVAFLASLFRSDAVAPLEPCQHRFAAVNTTVVHNVGFHHFIAVCLHNLGKAPTKEVVAHMSEVQWLVGVW